MNRGAGVVGLLLLGYVGWRTIQANRPVVVHILQLLNSQKYTLHSTTLVTTTPTYTYLPTHSPDTSQSSFISLQNVSFPAEIGYNDPEYVLNGTHSLACLPRIFGYEYTKGLEVFPWVGYPRCASLLPDPSPILSLDYTSNRLYMHCKTPGKYLLGPVDSRKLVLRHEVEPLWQVHPYTANVTLNPNHEFAFGTCESNEEYMTQAVYIPRYNASLHVEMKGKMKELKSEGPTLTVMILVVDSFSRKHFVRKLPQTVKYLNRLKKGEEYHVTDFYIHNIVGSNSVGNQAPLLGRNIQEAYLGDLNRDFAGDSALWNIYKNRGFVTLFGLESCDNSFPRKLGRKPNIDYVSSPFYCAAYKYTNYKASKDNKMQRCIGPYMSHFYLFNYTRTFASMYSDVHKWIYIHVDAAHESTGQHAETLDSDLVEFIDGFLRENPYTVLFLEGDHGMRYGDWMKSVEAFQENRLPPLFLLTPKSILREIPNSEEVLMHNSLRLNTKYDMRRTLIYLSTLPYGGIEPGEELYPAVNMYTMKAEDSRTCQQTGIPPWYCSCLVLIPIPASIVAGEVNSHAELTKMLRFIADDAVAYFNSLVYRSVHRNKGEICQKMHLKNIERAYGLQLDPMMEEIKLEFTISELETARFEVLYVLSSGVDFTTITEDGYPTSSLLYNGYRKKTRMLSYARLDKYGGKCEEVARREELEAEVCVCRG